VATEPATRAFKLKCMALQIALDRDLADYVMTGGGQSEPKTSWHEGFLTSSKDHATGNVLVIAKGSKTSDLGKSGRRQGILHEQRCHRRVAERLIKTSRRPLRKRIDRFAASGHSLLKTARAG
jgi:hypothetical protein